MTTSSEGPPLYTEHLPMNRLFLTTATPSQWHIAGSVSVQMFFTSITVCLFCFVFSCLFIFIVIVIRCHHKHLWRVGKWSPVYMEWNIPLSIWIPLRQIHCKHLEINILMLTFGNQLPFLFENNPIILYNWNRSIKLNDWIYHVNYCHYYIKLPEIQVFLILVDAKPVELWTRIHSAKRTNIMISIVNISI